MPKVILEKKAEVMAEFNFSRKKAITVGSGKENDIVIKDKSVSEHHCTISYKDGKYELKDNNTLSGTQVDGRSVTIYELRMGNRITVGGHSVVFRSIQSRRAKAVAPKETDDDSFSGGPGEDKMLFLLGIYGKFEGKKYEIKNGETFIGREEVTPRGIPNDIVLTDDMTVSKGHARITRAGDKCILTDTGSTGGVGINGAKVGQLNDVEIKPGDEIAIGRTIFRFTGGDPDYSAPKRYGAAFMKIRRVLNATVILAVVLSSLFYLFKGFNGISIINSSPERIVIRFDESWQAKGNTSHPAPEVYDITSSPALGDINKDGVNDIVFVNAAGQLSAYNGKTGTTLWSPVEVQAPGKASPVLADMNNDGVTDVVVLSGTSMIYVIDGQAGVVIHKDMLGGTISDMSPAVADINLDGRRDIVACSEEGTVYFIYSPGFELAAEKLLETVEGPVYASPVIIATRKISPLVVISSYNSKLFLFSGSSRDKKTIDLVERTGKAHLIQSSPGSGDLNGDGIPELIVQSSIPQYISAVDISGFEVKWTYFVDPVPPAELKHNSTPLVFDMDRDGGGDVLALSGNGTVYGLKGKTGYPAGELLWKYTFPSANRIISSPALFDFNKDGMQDAVFGGEDGTIHIFDGFAGKRETGRILAAVKASNAAITSSVALGDADGDGMMEVVYGDIADSLQVLRTNAKVFKARVYWPMFLGDAAHASSGSPDQAGPYIIMVMSSLVALIILALVEIMLKKRQLTKRPRVVYI